MKFGNATHRSTSHHTPYVMIASIQEKFIFRWLSIAGHSGEFLLLGIILNYMLNAFTSVACIISEDCDKKCAHR